MSNTKDSPVLYTEDTQTPTNINTTSQAPVTKGDDGVILDQYQDQNNQNQYASAPNTTTSAKDSSTGSGLTAAEGTEYSWDTKAKERADLSYKSDVLEAKSNYLTNRQELENQGQQSQTQIAMNKYSQGQSNEKAGWTGGYILDTERQMAYLKQTIQSQMYGAMELQKYGYDTSLAAARLAYDTNKYDLALEYYNTALSRAVSEAEITGYYVSPETSEMLDDYSIASKILNDDTATEEEKLRADKVLTSVYDWFESNGVSKQGVETMAHQEFIFTLKEATKKAVGFLNESLYNLPTGSFGKVDAQGKLVYVDETTIDTLDFGTMSAQEILEYATSGSNTATQQMYSYIKNKIEEDIQTYLTSKQTTENDKITYGQLKGDEVIEKINSSAAKIFNQLTEAASTNEVYKQVLNNFTYNTKVSDYDFKVTVSDGKLAFTHSINDKKEEDDAVTSYLGENVSSTFESIKSKGNDFSNYDITVSGVKGGKSDDDIELNIGGKNYDLDIDWKKRPWYQLGVNNYSGSQEDLDANFADLRKLYPDTSTNKLVIYKDQLFFYSKDIDKWGWVQMNVGGNKLKDDLLEAQAGNVPKRWK